MSLANKLKKTSKPKRTEPLWKGPCDPGPMGGVTQSLLGRFLGCRERFRIEYIEGLQPAPSFSPRMEYGQMWHACEEALAGGQDWTDHLKGYCRSLAQRFPQDGPQIERWYNVCKVQFPIYIDWWRKHPDVKNRKPLFQEQVFNVPHKLPSGRTVYLRGKWDSVDQIGSQVWLQENKSKGDINAPLLLAQLRGGDLQTMLYLTALVKHDKRYEIAGVRYNVVRRPLAGGRHSIQQRKGRQTKQGLVGAETDQEFYQRLGEEISGAIEDNGDHFFFMRWLVEVTADDLARFQREMLNPILEQLCDWYEYITGHVLWSDSNRLHFRMPYGIYQPLFEGRSTDLDEYINTGNRVGLVQVDSMFGELQ